MFGTYAAFLFTCPFIQKRFDSTHNIMRIVFASNVQMHVAVANMAISDASNDIFAQPLFHHFYTKMELDYLPEIFFTSLKNSSTSKYIK